MSEDRTEPRPTPNVRTSRLPSSESDKQVMEAIRRFFEFVQWLVLIAGIQYLGRRAHSGFLTLVALLLLIITSTYIVYVITDLAKSVGLLKRGHWAFRLVRVFFVALVVGASTFAMNTLVEFLTRASFGSG